MPWKKTDAMIKKETFVIKALGNDKSFTELCNDYEISTKTGYNPDLSLITFRLALTSFFTNATGTSSSAEKLTMAFVVL
jgi:hypothetical protein